MRRFSRSSQPAASPTRSPRSPRSPEAALRLISKHGLGALTHRAVAEEADVPLASTTYYFDSLDELLDRALQLFVDEEATRLTALAERLQGQELPRWRSRDCSNGDGLHRIAGCDDQGLEEALLALWAAATRAIGTR